MEGATTTETRRRERAMIGKQEIGSAIEREMALELFIKALEAKPDLVYCPTQRDGTLAAIDLIKGADKLIEYIREGKKP
jgi:hypothetical protein